MLFEKLKADRIQAMKDKDTLKKGLLGVIIGDSSKDDKNPDDTIVLAILKSFLKKNAQAQVDVGEANMEELYLDDLVKEEKIIESYLPQQLTVEGLRTAVKYAVEFDGATNMGDVMKYLKANHEGRYDGKLASQMAKEILG